jgi:hypothetical protein
MFVKFDTDGSGALDLSECVDLFGQNHIKLDKKTVRQIIGGEDFTI